MKVVIQVELNGVENIGDLKARWINNKVTAQLCSVIEKSALVQVVKVDVNEVKEN